MGTKGIGRILSEREKTCCRGIEMKVNLRKATAQDIPVLVDIYERAYLGGYSACFDKYGAVTPQDFWWVQSEKEVYLLEVNRRPIGLVIIGKDEGRLVVEELIGEAGSGRPSPLRAGGEAETLIHRVYTFLSRKFQEERQDLLLLRAAESNSFALSLAHRFAFTFSNALVVMSRNLSGKIPVEIPEGYNIRQAGLEDVTHIARMSQECLEDPFKPEDIRKFLTRPSHRGFLAVHVGEAPAPKGFLAGSTGEYPVGFLLVQVRDGQVGEMVVGVREYHRGKGLGKALGILGLNFLSRRHVSRVFTTHWALNPLAERFTRRLGFTPERVYMYFEKQL